MHRLFAYAGVLLLACVLCCGKSEAAGKVKRGYAALKQRLAKDDGALRRQFYKTRGKRSARYAKLEARLLRRIDTLFSSWIGSRWGLGMPQSTVPHKGKTNCGLFVAVILRDAGFRLPIWKFNRQAAYHAIKSIAAPGKVRYLARTTMKRFVEKVRAMGPGLYVIGLDFHIGFLRVKKNGQVRFVHGSYITHKVMDEPALTALPIVQARRSRMVGKILQPKMLSWWLSRKRIHVLGKR